MKPIKTNWISWIYCFFRNYTPGFLRKQTHMLMQLCIRATAKPGWYDTTPEEICAYLGCSVCMGIIRAPAQDLYWSKDKLFHLSWEIYKDKILEHSDIFSFDQHNTESTKEPDPGHNKLVHVRINSKGNNPGKFQSPIQHT